MRTMTTVGKAIGVGVLLATAIPAFAITKSGSNSYDFGNGMCGAKGTYSVNVEYYTGVSKLNLASSGDIKFLNKTAKGVGLGIIANASNNKPTGSVTVSYAGYSVNAGSGTASFSVNRTYPVTFISASYNLVLGGIPCTVSGSLGGGASAGLNMSLANTGVGLSGTGSAWGTATASAGVGASALNASLKANATVLKSSITPSITVKPAGGTGKVQLVNDPLSIDFSLVLQSKVLAKTYTWYTYVFANYSQPQQTITLLTF